MFSTSKKKDNINTNKNTKSSKTIVTEKKTTYYEEIKWLTGC